MVEHPTTGAVEVGWDTKQVGQLSPSGWSFPPTQWRFSRELGRQRGPIPHWKKRRDEFEERAKQLATHSRGAIREGGCGRWYPSHGDKTLDASQFE